IGICGSGLVDAISVLVENYIIDETGRFSEPDDWKPEVLCLKDRLTTINGETAFRIADDIYLYQQDIREVQLAKAAINAGITTLLKTQNVKYEEVDIVWLAGGFGNKLNKESAVNIGMLPKQLLDRIRPAGNTSGIGAIMSLLSEDCRRECDKIKEQAKYLELSALSGFNNTFIESMGFE
ncbi:MAG: ATP-binding protein, partial [Clostridiaceae bacterium]|nr:ATP-binding protein [Clostridiaceae bacterium]